MTFYPYWDEVPLWMQMYSILSFTSTCSSYSGLYSAPVLVKSDWIQTTWHSEHTVSLITFISEHYNPASCMLLGHRKRHYDWVNPSNVLDARVLDKSAYSLSCKELADMIDTTLLSLLYVNMKQLWATNYLSSAQRLETRLKQLDRLCPTVIKSANQYL